MVELSVDDGRLDPLVSLVLMTRLFEAQRFAPFVYQGGQFARLVGIR